MPYKDKKDDAYWRKTSPKYKKWRREYQRNYRTKNPRGIAITKAIDEKRKKKPQFWFVRYEYNAQLRNLPFELTYNEFFKLWDKPCYYCGAKVARIGLDRVDNTKGYAKDNVVPCCKTCNRMKMTLSEGDFIRHCQSVVNHYQKH